MKKLTAGMEPSFYINPATGGKSMPTMATCMQRLPAEFNGKPYRQTDGTVFSVVEGHGNVNIESNGAIAVHRFSPRGHFLIPSWHTATLLPCYPATLQPHAGCVLFSFSDRPVHRALGIHKSERML